MSQSRRNGHYQTLGSLPTGRGLDRDSPACSGLHAVGGEGARERDHPAMIITLPVDVGSKNETLVTFLQ
jgi:hypothetical protein